MEPQHDSPAHVGIVGIVDDDPAVRNSLKFSLEVDGLAVIVYASANELLQDGHFERFCCLVIDQHMPGMSGLDLAARLRDLQVSVPAILITSNPPKALVAGAVKAGMPIVEKPLLGNALQERIYQLIGAVPRED